MIWTQVLFHHFEPESGPPNANQSLCRLRSTFKCNIIVKSPLELTFCWTIHVQTFNTRVFGELLFFIYCSFISRIFPLNFLLAHISSQLRLKLWIVKLWASFIFPNLLQLQDSVKVKSRKVAFNRTWILPVHPHLELSTWAEKPHYLGSDSKFSSLLSL